MQNEVCPDRAASAAGTALPPPGQGEGRLVEFPRPKTAPAPRRHGPDHYQSRQQLFLEIVDDLRRVPLIKHARLSPQTALADAASDWLSSLTTHESTTRKRYEYALCQHVYPLFGDREIGSISTDDLRVLIVAMNRAGLAPATTRAALAVTSNLLGHAVRGGALPRNPMLDLRRGERPQVGSFEHQILNATQIGAVLAAGRKQRVLLATAIFTGLRSGEIRGLLRSDIDLPRRLIYVRRQAAEDGSYKALKTLASKRDVVLAAQLAPVIEAHLASMPSDANVPVFKGRNAQPLTSQALRDALRYAVQRAAMPAPAGARPLRFHDLRHPNASLLIAAGADITYVQQQLGHSSALVTLKYYAHLFAREANASKVQRYLDDVFCEDASGGECS